MLIHQEVFFWLQLCNADLIYHLLPSNITCLNPFVYNRLELCTSYIEIKELIMAIINNSIYTSTVLTGIRIEYHLIFWCFG